MYLTINQLTFNQWGKYRNSSGKTIFEIQIKTVKFEKTRVYRFNV